MSQDSKSNAEQNIGDVPGTSSTATGMAHKEATENLPELFRVGVKVPPFYPNSPALWFSQLDGQFILSGVKSDSTKFYYAIAQLEHQYALEIADLITNPPEKDMYETLRREVIRRLSATKEQKVRQFLELEEMGNRKPSQYLRHLINLAGPEVPGTFVRTIWASRLPKELQPIIASHQDLNVEKLATLADEIHAITAPSANIVAEIKQPDVQPSSSTPFRFSPQQPVGAMEAMALQIAQLSEEIRNLKMERSRPVFRRRFNSRSRSRSKSRDTSGICWYHRRFKNRAEKCTKPCNFQAGNFQGSH